MQCAPVSPPLATSSHSTVTNWSWISTGRVVFVVPLSSTTPAPRMP